MAEPITGGEGNNPQDPQGGEGGKPQDPNTAGIQPQDPDAGEGSDPQDTGAGQSNMVNRHQYFMFARFCASDAGMAISL